MLGRTDTLDIMRTKSMAIVMIGIAGLMFIQAIGMIAYKLYSVVTK